MKSKLEINVARLETDMKNVIEEVKELKENVKSLATKEDVAAIKDSLNTFIEKADERYAGKWVEKPMVVAATMIGTAVLGGLLSLIIIKN